MQDDEAAKLKTQVEYANSVAARAEEQLEQVGRWEREKRRASSQILSSKRQTNPPCPPITRDSELEQLEQEMNLLVNQVPNLLDDRVPDGEDETVNQVVAEWGAEKRKIGGGFMWHDDIATKLGGYDPATAVSCACGGGWFACACGRCVMARVDSWGGRHRHSMCLMKQWQYYHRPRSRARASAC